METKSAKVLGSKGPNSLNLKRKQGAQYEKYTGTELPSGYAMNSSIHQLLKRRKLDVSRCKNDGVTSHGGKSTSICYENFLKSGIPQRLMFYEKGEWVDYPQELLEAIKKDLQAKKPTTEIQFNKTWFVLDFLHMLQLDMNTGFQQSIAWIDETGSCFFPQSFDYKLPGSSHEVPETQAPGNINLQLEIAIDGIDILKMLESSGESDAAIVKEIRVDPNFSGKEYDAGHSCTNEENVKVDHNVGENHKDGTDILLENLDSDAVKEIFFKGLSSPKRTEVIDITYGPSFSKEARFELFLKQIDITKRVRGDANVRYAWLPSSKKLTSSIIKYGFGLMEQLYVKPLHGVGVNLIPANCTDISAKHSDVDENGVRHMLFCRVIMGNTEIVHPGSKQFHPSSEEFDSGVDDVQNPKRYVVWNMNVNSHIFPEYAVSFKISSDTEGLLDKSVNRLPLEGPRICYPALQVQACDCHLALFGRPTEQGVNLGQNSVRTPKSPWMPFSKLFAAIYTKVPERHMAIVLSNFQLFRDKKMSRDDFITRLRMLVGDSLLRSTIAGLKCQCKKPSDLMMLSQPDTKDKPDGLVQAQL